MNLTAKSRAAVETALESLIGLAVATPVVLTSTGVSTKVGAGAVVLAVSVGVTNLVQVPAVQRFLDRMLGTSGEQQLVSLANELQGVEAVIAEHVQQHPAATSSSSLSSEGAAAGAASVEPVPSPPPAAAPAAPGPGTAEGGTPAA